MARPSSMVCVLRGRALALSFVLQACRFLTCGKNVHLQAAFALLVLFYICARAVYDMPFWLDRHPRYEGAQQWSVWCNM